jgi:hypothetical protein|tara:strand:- start:2274 stop:3641 length:1368 start_codon:yes stop_codon:yes gene_type:complete
MTISRTGLILNLEMGNNNGSSKVYDTSGSGFDFDEAGGGTITFTEGSDGYIEGTNQAGDMIQYIAGGLYNSEAELSYCIEFAPDFETDNNDTYVFTNSYDTVTTVDRYFIAKLNNASSNSLRIQCGGTIIENIPEATYSPFWKVGKRNALVVTSDSAGTTSAWLNGNIILNADATTWTPKIETFMSIIGNAGQGFDGKIYAFRIWNRILTAAEIASCSAMRRTKIIESAGRKTSVTIDDNDSLTLDLDFGNNDGTSLIYDKSFTSVNQTTVNAPTLSEGSGGYMDLNGSTQYSSGTGTGVYNAVNTSIAYIFTPDFDADDGAYHVLSDGADGSTRYGVFKQASAQSNTLLLMLGNTSIGTVSLANYQDYWNKDDKNVLVVTGTTGNNNIWLNGNQIMTANATAWSAANPATIYIGASYAGSSGFDGKIHEMKVWDRILTTAEVASISANRKTNLK